MKTVKAAILAMIFLLLFSISSFAAEGTITASKLKFRMEPSLEGDIISELKKDDKVEIIEKTNDKWYKVNYNGTEGYVSAEYVNVEEEVIPTPVTTEEPEIETENLANENSEESKIFKTSSDIDVYIIPVINSSIINKIETGKQVNVIKIINKWAYVECESIYGWVVYKNLENSELVPEVTAQPTPSPEVVPEETIEPEVTQTPIPEITEEEENNTEKVGYINVSTYANLRKEPSTEATVLDTLQRNTVVTVLSEEEGWAKIKVNGITGYVSKDLVSSTKLEEIDTTSRGNNSEREPENKEEVKVEETTTEVSTNTNGAAIVEFAKKYLGYKYVLGGTTPSGGFDCSGFVYYVFGQMGKSISRSLSVQSGAGTAVSKANLQPGDIVIFNDSSNSSLGHVGIYVGDSQFIHAANPKRGVVIDYLDSRNSYYNERYVTARRV